jgi:hypothetical protein
VIYFLRGNDWWFAPPSGPQRLHLKNDVVRLTPMHAMWSRRPSDLLLIQSNGASRHIVALDAATGRACHLSPSYVRTIRRGDEKLRVWVASADADVDRAIALIRQEHPEPPRRRGTFICMASAGDDTSATLIGAAVLDGLVHGNPIDRDVLARPVLGDDWLDRLRARELSRGEIVYRLGLVCGTRFAVRRDRQGEGLGDILAHQSAIVAACWRWPPADNVEVVRWMPGTRLAEVLGGKSDFLTRAGYTPVPSSHWTRGGKHVPDRIPTDVTARSVLAWYYRPVTSLRSDDPIIRAALRAARKAALCAA